MAPNYPLNTDVPTVAPVSSSQVRLHWVVIDENTLCCVDSRLPNSGQVVASSIVNGAKHSWQSGVIGLPMDPARVRPARLSDAAFFRYNFEAFRNDRIFHYEVPTE